LLVSLSSDHGGTDFPADGRGGYIRLSDEAGALNAWARDRWGIALGADEDRGLMFGDVAALQARGVNVDSLRTALARRVALRPGVRRVYTPATLATDDDHDALMWRRLIPENVDWLVAVSIEEGWLWSSDLTESDHGSTNLVDVRVPIIVRFPGRRPRNIDRPVAVVDLAPTIAALIGVVPTEPLDGRTLAEVVDDPR
jgi:arylsulfatase A-like enzyme